MLAYLGRVALALDQLANAILGGEPCDSISFRAAVARMQGARWACVLCLILDLFQRNHCDRAMSAEDRDRIRWGDATERGEHPL